MDIKEKLLSEMEAAFEVGLKLFEDKFNEVRVTPVPTWSEK